ncbi:MULTISPECIES: hypothetical protein [Pseudobutyrivibrio]|uniref:Uncharacterized protein n=1 Tax=Pseudobutyrivibrio xylanivorans TaxID=185007 RepID=A0A1G5S557_PSEXY|nr:MULTISPECIES: hypothetical protein [Pseudobutyrivibrio]MDC7279933.1 hypothetical protein [Butyrivibrio fibrisolvens]SCZ81456.1 hypothetical protein SAMN02910350_02830 [Pseudobutyrivibrio xylanivorans]
MNFYIGNSVNEVNVQDFNIEFSDELLDYIYKIHGEAHIDMSKLFQIQPYEDMEISKDDLPLIANICIYILENSMLKKYDEPDEGQKMVKDLFDIIQKAQAKGKGIVSIGD